MLQSAGVRADGRVGLAVSDFFDFSVYVDAATSDIRRWYTDRFLRLRETAFRDPASYFARYASLSHDEAVAEASRIWDEINGPNLKQNVAAHPLARDPGAAQGPRPLGALGPAPQAVSEPEPIPPDPLGADRDRPDSGYAGVFEGLIDRGEDIDGEARLADVLAPRAARILDAGAGMGGWRRPRRPRPRRHRGREGPRPGRPVARGSSRTCRWSSPTSSALSADCSRTPAGPRRTTWWCSSAT